MEWTTLKVPGRDAIRLLNERRSLYASSGQYPFVIGYDAELQRIKRAAEFNAQDPAAIIHASLGIQTANWIESRREEAEEFGFSVEETLGEWPAEIHEKASIGLHKDVVSGKIKADVWLGLATIEKPWHLPAVLKYGGWNECPAPEVHCAFYRDWQDRFGAEITGMSSDVIECAVANPPTDQRAAFALAWEQYWYCPDIVEQGCGSVSHLAATLLNSQYWYFWWD